MSELTVLMLRKALKFHICLCFYIYCSCLDENALLPDWVQITKKKINKRLLLQMFSFKHYFLKSKNCALQKLAVKFILFFAFIKEQTTKDFF